MCIENIFCVAIEGETHHWKFILKLRDRGIETVLKVCWFAHFKLNKFVMKAKVLFKHDFVKLRERHKIVSMLLKSLSKCKQHKRKEKKRKQHNADGMKSHLAAVKHSHILIFRRAFVSDFTVTSSREQTYLRRYPLQGDELRQHLLLVLVMRFDMKCNYFTLTHWFLNGISPGTI